jgi:hypothetical protein
VHDNSARFESIAIELDDGQIDSIEKRGANALLDIHKIMGKVSSLNIRNLVMPVKRMMMMMRMQKNLNLSTWTVQGVLIRTRKVPRLRV